MSGPLHIISLGAGVQSSTMALMAAAGEIKPMPDAAIFADTQAEPKKVYGWLDWLVPMLPFPVHQITAGSLTEAQLTLTKASEGADYLRNLVPAFTQNPDGSTGMLLRKCTGDYKLAPLRRKVRELYLLAGKPKVHQWIGISLDEATRMKPSGVKYIENRWPLIELRMSRRDCLNWMKKSGHPEPPKSACTYCPYHNDDQWRELKRTDPDEFEAAAKFEEQWNALARADTRPSLVRGVIRLHRSLKPLREVDLSTAEERGQLALFEEDCEGMCGV